MSYSDGVASATKALKTWLIVGGILALLAGIGMLWLPGAFAIAVTTLIAIYAVLAGIVYLAIAIAGKGLSGLSRLGHALAGVLFIVAGVIAFMNPAGSAAAMVTIVAIFVGVAWIFEGVAALTTLSIAPSKGWAIFYAIVSIIGGGALIAQPLIGGAVMIQFAAIALIVFGIVGITRGVMIGKRD